MHLLIYVHDENVCVKIINVLFPRCEINLNLCGNNPCQHEGQCVDSGNGVHYTCICQPDYTGKNCETEISKCYCLLLLMCPLSAFIWRFHNCRERERQTDRQTDRDRDRKRERDREREKHKLHQTLFLNASWHGLPTNALASLVGQRAWVHYLFLFLLLFVLFWR